MKPFINQFDARFVSRWTKRFYRRVAPELAVDRRAKDAHALLKLPAIVEPPSRLPRGSLVLHDHEGRREYGVIEGLGYSKCYREFAGKQAHCHQERQTCLGVHSITAASLVN